MGTVSRVRTSTVVVHNEKLLVFRAIDPTHHKEYLFLPGGEIEPNETAPEAAIRETLEETGYVVTINPEHNVDKEYPFHWNGVDYDVLTLFYRAHLESPFSHPKPVNDAPYHRGVLWIPIQDIDFSFSYSEPIKSAIKELLYAY